MFHCYLGWQAASLRVHRLFRLDLPESFGALSFERRSYAREISGEVSKRSVLVLLLLFCGPKHPKFIEALV